MPLAVVRTNLVPSALPATLLKDLNDTLLQEFPDIDPQLAMVELHTDVTMLRHGSTAPMVTMEIHHSDVRVNTVNKRHVADKFALLAIKQMKINMDRVLILFFDTRCCSAPEVTHL